jgi:hypothetical protein
MMTRRLTILFAVTAFAVAAGASSAGAATYVAPNLENTLVSSYSAKTPSPSQTTAANSNGIIMRDGGPCDPIRHMGC